MSGARFVGPGRTRPEFTLMPRDGFPALVAGGKEGVAGEVYEVDSALMERLDAFEEHPTVYIRDRITLDDGRTVETYLRR
jgi:gamma-glutamylcyclotransferase (GGCT)/AIG2-like uncharacterized protein YtfP